MVKGAVKKKNNFIKLILVGLLVLAIIFLAFKIFFTGQAVSGTTTNTTCSLNYTLCRVDNIAYCSYTPSPYYTYSNACPSSRYTNSSTSSIGLVLGDRVHLSCGGYIQLQALLKNLDIITFKICKDTDLYLNEVCSGDPINTIFTSNGVGTISVSGIVYSILNATIGITLSSLNESCKISSCIMGGKSAISCRLLNASQSPSPANTSISNLTTTTTNRTGNASVSSCFSVAQVGCLNTSKICCSGLKCYTRTDGSQYPTIGICLPIRITTTNQTLTSCISKNCSQLGKTCGTVSNGCNGTLNCGTCSQLGKTCVSGRCLGNYGTYCTTGSQCHTGRCKPLTKFLWFKMGNYCY